jgi:hypothetical protein
LDFRSSPFQRRRRRRGAHCDFDPESFRRQEAPHRLVAARAKMLAGIKQKHEEEILDEAFRTTEEIRGELDVA